ncbi:hypothetical protein DY000_02063785 [Brassica cretica]|uniref:60S ribosomal protein L29 n=1 Tax=Brassica cretica TaxID=69181 RepID=A0ABQ7B032_BRACR|nr:hypothetical protein DY000_02063785 [Brassica cretica]
MAHMKALFHYVKMDQFMMFSGSSSGFRVCSCIWLIKIFNYDRKRYFKKMFERLYQDKDQLRRKLLLPSPLYKNRLNIGLRSPHAKHAAAIQAKLLGGNPAGEMSKNALKNKKKKGAEAAASGANNA